MARLVSSSRSAHLKSSPPLVPPAEYSAASGLKVAGSAPDSSFSISSSMGLARSASVSNQAL